MTTKIQTERFASSLRWLLAVLLVSAYSLSGLTSANAQVVLDEAEWSIIGGDQAWFLDTGNGTRGLARNPVTGNILIATRSGGTAVKVIDPATGSVIKDLDVTGIEGGFFAINKVAVTADGQIFVANFSLNGPDYKIYYYADEDAAPAELFSGDPYSARIGDAFAVSGTGDDVTLYASGTGVSNLAVFTYDGSIIAHDRNVPLGGDWVNGHLVDNGDGTAWVNAREQAFRKIDLTTGEAQITIPADIISFSQSEFAVGTFDGRTLMASGYGPATENIVRIYDMTDPMRPVQIAKTDTMGNGGSNGFRVGGVAFDTENNKMFALSNDVAIEAYDITEVLDVEYTTVTFRVNTSTVPDTLRESDRVYIRGAYQPGGTGDYVEGNFFGQDISWGTTLPMTNVGGDYWERDVIIGKGDGMQWKYFPQFADGSTTDSPDDGWETDPTRTIVVPTDAAAAIDLDQAYWNKNAPFVAEEDSLTMFFRVNVGNSVALGRLDPENENHRVGVRGVPEVFGNAADWSNTEFYLEAEPHRSGSANYFYSGALRLPIADLPAITDEFAYKFVVEGGAGTDWDDNPGFPDGNRFAPLSEADSTLRWVFFQNSAPPQGEIVQASLQFAVNVGVLEGLGYFDSAIDDVTIPGGFNGWDTNTAADYNSALNVWTAAFQVTEEVGATVEYKYYVRWDESRFDEESPNYIPNLDAGNGWEEPGITGGSNRIYTFTNETVQEVDDFGSGIAYFNGVPEQGVIGETISGNDVLTTRFVVDMTEALTHSTPFDPENDELYLIIETPFFALSQGLTSGAAILDEGNEAEAARVMLSPAGDGNLWELELDVLLPTENHIGFIFTYVKPDGERVSNGGGFGPGRRYYRYIQPLDVSDPTDILWPDTDELNLITWRPGEDLDFETPPNYGLTSSIGENIKEVVNTFQLYQNYPNPFNPTTNISYTVPQSSEVRIDIFNVLGQRVATLVNNRVDAGTHTVQFDARSFASGMYLYRIQAGDFVSTRQMMLIK
jgi:hypothetical protein